MASDSDVVGKAADAEPVGSYRFKPWLDRATKDEMRPDLFRVRAMGHDKLLDRLSGTKAGADPGIVVDDVATTADEWQDRILGESHCGENVAVDMYQAKASGGRVDIAGGVFETALNKPEIIEVVFAGDGLEFGKVNVRDFDGDPSIVP